MELLALEMVHYYQNQTRLPCAAAIEAIGGTCTWDASCPFPDACAPLPFMPQSMHEYVHGSPTGFRVGRQLAERYTANRARTGEPLEVIKFICKEFWVAVFRKQVLYR